MTLPVEVNIDATSLRTSNCMLDMYRTVVEGYRSPVVSADIIYGVAVHKFIDTMFKTKGDLRKARDAAYLAFRIKKFDKAKKPHMSDERHMLTTCLEYWENVVSKESTFDTVLLPNGEPATEVTFKFLYYEDAYLKVNLAGTIDKLGKFKNGCYAIGDYKTTSSWDDRSYFSSYELSIQLRFYVLALRWMASYEPESVLGKIGATKVGAFIDALFIKSSVAENLYKRSEVFQFDGSHLDEIKQLLDRKIQALSQEVMAISKGESQRPLKEGILHGTCEKKFGKCQFWNCCRSNDTIADILLKRDFIQKHYDPLHFND